MLGMLLAEALKQAIPGDDPLYSSGNLWAIAGVGAAIILGIGAIVANYQSANPLRRQSSFAAKLSSARRLTAAALDTTTPCQACC
jgi:hypothetical protein